MIKRKKSDNYKNRFIDKLINTALYILWGVIFLFCALLLLCTKGHCASNDVNSYPFNIATQYVDNTTGNTINGIYFDYLLTDKETLIEHINSDLTAQNVTYDSYLVFLTDISNRTTNLHGAQPHIQITYTILTNPTINTTITQTDSFTSVVCPITYTNNINYRQVYIPSTDANSYSYRATYNGGTFNALGTPTFINYTPFTENSYMGSGVYNANYPIIAYNIGNGLISTNDSLCIIDFEYNFPTFTGHATPPDEFEQIVTPNDYTLPREVPQLVINNYTWTSTPTPDFSTLEDTCESIYHFLQWLGSNLMGASTNVVDNIKNVGDYIGQTIQYYGGLIVRAIQNGIETFYNNMVSLFEPISSAIDYISQPLQVQEVVTAMQSTAIHTDIVSVVNLSNTAFGIFGTVSEPSEFKIPLDLTGITILHQTQPFYIDLGWINSAKSYIRAFMWCVVTFGLLYSIIFGIPSMLKDSK